MAKICPNCTSPVEGHPENGCVLAALITVLRDREELEEVDVQRIHANCNIDLLWGAVARIVDDLGEGAFLTDTE